MHIYMNQIIYKCWLSCVINLSWIAAYTLTLAIIVLNLDIETFWLKNISFVYIKFK